MREGLDQSYIAALSSLTSRLSSLHARDDHDALAHLGLATSSTMGILDALSALCVRDADDVYSVTLLLQGSEITLLVATAGIVPDHVEQRLEAVWQFMHNVHQHDDRELIRRGDWSIPTVRNLSHEFAVEHCRYAMPALRARLIDDVAVILQCMRQLLDFSGEPSPGQAAQLDDLGHKGPTLQDSQRHLLEETIPKLTFLRDTMSAESVTDNRILAVMQGIADLHAALKPHLESFNGTVFTMMEVICGKPVHRLLRRALWLCNHFSYITGFVIAGKFAPFANLRLRVRRLPPIVRQVPAVCKIGHLPDLARRLYRANAADFDDDFRVHVLDALGPFSEEVPPDASADADQVGPTLDVLLHGEMVILDYLNALPQRPVAYIGCSEPSCLPCYALLCYYSEESGKPGVHTAGTDGQTHHPWAPPEIDIAQWDPNSICHYGELVRQFCTAWIILSQAHKADREGSYEWYIDSIDPYI